MATERLVLCHFMMWPALAYTRELWMRDYELAQASGIDAFVLNFSPGFRGINEHLQRAYDAAAEFKGGSFKLVVSPDVAGQDDKAEDIANCIKPWIHHPSALKYRGKTVVTTFAGSHLKFGEATAYDGWKKLLDPFRRDIYFAPCFFLEHISWSPDLLRIVDLCDAVGCWTAPWDLKDGRPTGNNDKLFRDILGARGKQYLGCVAPSFSCHHPMRNWTRSHDSDLFGRRWEQLLAMQPDMIEVISWNDYGESHHIGPLGTTAVADKFDHAPFLAVNSYFSSWFKSGRRPTIRNDHIHVTYRTHPKDAKATDDPVGPPEQYETCQDIISIVAFIRDRSPVASLKLNVGAVSHSFAVQQGGLLRFQAPMATGPVVIAALDAQQRVIKSAAGRLNIVDRPPKYNFDLCVLSLNLGSAGDSIL